MSSCPHAKIVLIGIILKTLNLRPLIRRERPVRTTQRVQILAAILTVFSELAFIATPVVAQSGSRRVPNSYEDFPFNQGSLFYAPRGSNASTRRTRKAPRR